MKRILFLFTCIAIHSFCMAYGMPRIYEYDEAGNRIVRKTVTFTPAPPAPPVPPDSLETDIESQTSLKSFVPEYYVEKVARVEIKIYPNPTTENVTLEIADWETLQTGIFKLYSLTGQLLQERPVHSATTTVSLANLPRGAYILKVNINNRIEDWKVIKN